MTTNRTPQPEQVYRSPDGLPMLYVRTEQRPGASGAQHLFVETRQRLVLERWLPEGEGCPPELTLVLDPDATCRADRVADELDATLAKVRALSAALRRAVEVVPVDVANHLRSVYTQALGSYARRR